MVKKLERFSFEKDEQLSPQKVEKTFKEVIQNLGIQTLTNTGIFLLGVIKEHGLDTFVGWKQTGFYEDGKTAVSICCDIDNGEVMIIDNNDIYIITTYNWQDGGIVFGKDKCYRYDVQYQEFVVL